ncbi:hypothetical protein UFOVP435_25 [uncultured Caudovirales phage]|uniref:Uncharacterized protein n=1 Tax=uncultured Caudovirales phage TaxID=2100421 RepID=A0A6J5MGD8_9CAUD|nr:hypothetical protein UFOVP435_25 [uncultured Caudovirales phage]
MLSISVTNISGSPIVITAPGQDDLVLNEGCSTLIGPVSPTSPEQSDMAAPEIVIKLLTLTLSEENQTAELDFETAKTADSEETKPAETDHKNL